MKVNTIFRTGEKKIKKPKEQTDQNRRKFLFSILPVCAFGCLGFSRAFDNNQSGQNVKEAAEETKFQNEFCRTYEKVWQWRYHYYIDLMEELAKVVGRAELMEMIKKGKDAIKMKGAENNPNFKLSEFGNYVKNSEYFNNALTFEIIENTDTLFEIKITRCLWAKTFQEKNAADIGYATICHGDFSGAKAMHPKLHLDRTKTLMQGFDCCHERYVFES